MGRLTKRSLSLADRMKAAGIDPIWVAEVQSLVVGYSAQRGNNQTLWADNMALRKKVADLEAAVLFVGVDHDDPL